MKILYLILAIYSANILLAQKTSKSEKPFILGQIDEINSKVLNEKRILNIYLPEGYNEKDSIHYPVIYLLDGSADEDFIHVVGLVQFNTFEWVKQIPKSIVVGIANIDRKRDFTFPTTIESDKKRFPTTGGSEKFIQFIEQELQPYIQQNFKASTAKTIIGQSLGGLLATEILYSKPSLFSTYIIISPSLWWDNASLLKQNLPDLKSKTSIYIGVGKEGLTPTEIPHVMEVDANVLYHKIKSLDSKNTKVYFDYLPLENHASISHQALMNAFRLLYSKNQIK